MGFRSDKPQKACWNSGNINTVQEKADFIMESKAAVTNQCPPEYH